RESRHARFPQRGADFNHQLAPVVVEVAGEAWDERGVVHAVHLGVPLLDSLERFGEALHSVALLGQLALEGVVIVKGDDSLPCGRVPRAVHGSLLTRERACLSSSFRRMTSSAA